MITFICLGVLAGNWLLGTWWSVALAFGLGFSAFPSRLKFRRKLVEMGFGYFLTWGAWSFWVDSHSQFAVSKSLEVAWKGFPGWPWLMAALMGSAIGMLFFFLGHLHREFLNPLIHKLPSKPK